jgi:hypothetical protein
MDQPDAHPLDEWEALADEDRERLAGQWLSSVEEFLALAAGEEGRRGLSALLARSEEEFAALLDSARDLVGAETAERLLTTTAPERATGLAIPPETLEELERAKDDLDRKVVEDDE